MSTSVLDRILTRVKGLKLFREGSVLRGEKPLFAQIGDGKVLDNITKAVDNVVKRVREVKPNIIPTVVERVRTYQPGTRIQQLLPSTPPSTTATTATQTAQSKKLLRG